MKNSTANELIKAFDRPDLFDLCNAWLNSKAFAEIISEEVIRIQTQVLKDIPVHAWTDPNPKRAGTGWNGHRITDPKETYLALKPGDPSNDPLVPYWNACDKAEREAGIKPADMDLDHCPALVARTKQLEVEWELFRITGEIMDVPALDLYGDKRAQFLDLTIRALVNHPHFKRDNYFDNVAKAKSFEEISNA